MLHLEASPHQGIYAPLSQAMTDSESEEEIQIHNTTKHRKFQRQQLELLQQQQHQQRQTQHQQQPLQQQEQYKQREVQQKEQQQSLQQHWNCERDEGNHRVRAPPSSLALEQQQRLQAPPTQNKKKLKQRQRQIQLQSYVPESQQKYPFQNNSIGNGQEPSSYTTKMQTTFRSVMMSDMLGSSGAGIGSVHGDGPAGSNFSSFNSDYDERNHIDVADNVAILGGSSSSSILKHADEPMSPIRRCCFIASLLLCVLIVCAFVWVVPCGEGGTCPAEADRIKTHNWQNKYTRIELKGGVHIVNGLRQWENNLIFLYRGDVFFPEFGGITGPGHSNVKRNGIISLIGSSGVVAWYEEMVDEPVAIDCTLLDVDRNGRPDCLVVDECGQLGTINPISGHWHWRYKERSAHRVDALDFPVILPDLDGDGVLEVLLVTSAELQTRVNQHIQRGEVTKAPRNVLRILSGRQGMPIGEGYNIHDCDVLRKLQLDEPTQTLSFNCLRNNTEAQRSKTLGELYALITNKSLLGKQRKLPPVSKISQHRHYGQRKDTDAQRNIYSLSGRELVVENRGKCPEDCTVTMMLSETRNGKTHMLRNFTFNEMYGMVPTQWHFKKTKPKMSGFVMKFWKWTGSNHSANNQSPKTLKNNGVAAKANTLKDYANSKPTKPNQTHANKLHTNKSHQRQKRNPLEHLFPTRNFDIFESRIQKRETHSLQQQQQEQRRVVRSINANKNATNTKLVLDYKMQMIAESVMLIIFIGADTHIENTSQSNIIQFCRRQLAADGVHSELLCQPDLNNQESSMLIADLDQNGSQELITYLSTFARKSEQSNDWQLSTDVRLLCLEKELAAFYEDKKLHH